MPKPSNIAVLRFGAIRLIMIVTSIALAGCATSTKHASRDEAGPDAGSTGNIYANCDNAFVLYVNNRKVLTNTSWAVAPSPFPVSLAPGDVIKVRASDFGGPYGFAFLYCSSDKTAFFSANTNNWYTYTPADEVAWWNVPEVDALKLVPASEGSAKVVAAELEFQADAPCKNVIWGDSGEPTAFLLHVVTERDLRKVREP
jgi:hypothetical protein